MEELDLKEVLKMFYERKILIILITILFCIIGGLFSFYIMIPKYKATTTLVITQGNTVTNTGNTISESGVITDSATKDVTLSQKLVTTYSTLIKSSSILRQVMSNLEELNLTEEELRDNIIVTEVDDTEIIQIVVINENPEYSAKIANEISIVFKEKVNEMYKLNNVYTLDTAEIPDKPYNINHIKYIILFGLIGFVFICICIVLFNMFDNTTKNKEDIEKILGVPVLVSLEKYQEKKKGGAK